jgi:hypothetical protein
VVVPISTSLIFDRLEQELVYGKEYGYYSYGQEKTSEEADSEKKSPVSEDATEA